MLVTLDDLKHIWQGHMDHPKYADSSDTHAGWAIPELQHFLYLLGLCLIFNSPCKHLIPSQSKSILFSLFQGHFLV